MDELPVSVFPSSSKKLSSRIPPAPLQQHQGFDKSNTGIERLHVYICTLCNMYNYIRRFPKRCVPPNDHFFIRFSTISPPFWGTHVWKPPCISIKWGVPALPARLLCQPLPFASYLFANSGLPQTFPGTLLPHYSCFILLRATTVCIN